MEVSAEKARQNSAIPAVNAGVPLTVRQNTDGMVTLLKAMTVSHGRAQRLDTTYVVVSVLLAACGLAATFVNQLATPVAIIGGLWAVGYGAGLGTWAITERRRASIIQEMFDVTLFALPWNNVAAGDPVDAHEISWLANRYHGDESTLQDYYEVPLLERPYDVIACQLQNLAWGARIRLRYARVVLATIIMWVAAGFAVGIVGRLTVTDIALRWYVPSLGALLLAWNSFRGQHAVAAERDRVRAILWTRVRASIGRPGVQMNTELIGLARAVQDAILATRKGSVRVPNWFFGRFQAADRQDLKAVMADLVAVLHGMSTVHR